MLPDNIEVTALGMTIRNMAHIMAGAVLEIIGEAWFMDGA